MSESTKLDLLYLSEPDMITAGVRDMSRCIDTMEEVMGLLHDGDYRMGGSDHNSHGMMITFPDHPLFPAMPHNAADRRFMAMPAYIGGRFDVAGVKWYGSNTENREKGLPRSIHLVVLNDKDTGAPIAVMAGNLVSAYRTGAIPGLGAKLLAREDAHVLAVIGPGVMNRTAVEAFVSARPGIDTLRIHGRRRVTSERFEQYVREQFPSIVTIEICDTIEEAVRGADIISSATTGARGSENYPYIAEEWIKPGALLTVPANLRLDEDFLIERAHKFVDHMGLYKSWASEYDVPKLHEFIGIIGTHFIDLINEEAIPEAAVTSLGQVVRGDRPGRTSDDEIIVLSIGGMPVEDMAWGVELYRTAVEQGIGVRLPFWDQPALS
ncbi:ornithine cyclodeaminase [Pseudoclavibacter sp. CFCC 13796]|uniref:tyramine oxidase subunit B n=1 Tax=Pseudoclavibacter sp. CFCC 13796 TaxID=2615179 RepID=UPI001300FD34|nr:tyramine oxidase subunit B [Pseudoclavibacter sp. CFCC 13796]KAB1660821.1 ornithine cyclodeaminase [Pseudoclavibacter sp. CFCC 13796]